MGSQEIRSGKSTTESKELYGTAIGQYLLYAKKAREQGYEYVAQLFEEAYKSYLKDNNDYI